MLDVTGQEARFIIIPDRPESGISLRYLQYTVGGRTLDVEVILIVDCREGRFAGKKILHRDRLCINDPVDVCCVIMGIEIDEFVFKEPGLPVLRTLPYLSQLRIPHREVTDAFLLRKASDVPAQLAARERIDIVRQDRKEQQRAGKRAAYPPQTFRPRHTEPYADGIAPDVERQQIDTQHRHAVVAETADDADGHQHQQRQHDKRKPAEDPPVEPSVFRLETDRIEQMDNNDGKEHQRRYQPAYPSVGQRPFEDDLEDVEIQRGEIGEEQGEEQEMDDAVHEPVLHPVAGRTVLFGRRCLHDDQRGCQEHEAEDQKIKEMAVADLGIEQIEKRQHQQLQPQEQESRNDYGQPRTPQESDGKADGGPVVPQPAERNYEEAHRNGHAAGYAGGRHGTVQRIVAGEKRADRNPHDVRQQHDDVPPASRTPLHEQMEHIGEYDSAQGQQVGQEIDTGIIALRHLPADEPEMHRGKDDIHESDRKAADRLHKTAAPVCKAWLLQRCHTLLMFQHRLPICLKADAETDFVLIPQQR